MKSLLFRFLFHSIDTQELKFNTKKMAGMVMEMVLFTTKTAKVQACVHGENGKKCKITPMMQVIQTYSSCETYAVSDEIGNCIS